uniref:Uncharacterized protein n=1 Tax=viral metagenome TaxID=1070528 RepID=A0A6C0BB22_9ZZZZ
MSYEFKDALNTYYSLKQQYEEEFSKQKTKIIKKRDLSWNEKRAEFLKLKQKCINCKRPVGTIFSTKKVSAEFDRHLIAICGDRTDPCPLNIDLNVGFMINILDSIHTDEKDIENYKKDIINKKNDLLFGYISSEEAVNQFDEIKENISAIISTYEYTVKLYLNTVDNKEKKAELKKIQTELFLQISNFKKIVDNYEKSEDTQFMTDAIELYIQVILPNAHKIRDLTYEYSAVEYNEDDNMYYLIQKPVTIEQLEYNFSTDPIEIVSMKIGFDKSQKKTVEKKKKKEKEKEKEKEKAIPELKKKKKASVKLVLREEKKEEEKKEEEEEKGEEDEEEEEEQEEEEDEEELRPRITIQPRLLDDGSISATEAARLGWKIETAKGKLIVRNPTSGETYEVTAEV